jgi:aspartate/methionine/tyrosine aminotransferase
MTDRVTSSRMETLGYNKQGWWRTPPGHSPNPSFSGGFLNIDSFKLERYFAEYEFSARYLLSPSDCEALSLQELLNLADVETRGLWDGLKLGYTESQGHPMLREEISRLYKHIPAGQILTAVPEEAVWIAMNVLLQPGSRVVVVWPAYQSLFEIARSIGCEVVPWPLEVQAGRWGVNLERLERALKGATMLVLNFPHNPTGFLPDAKTYAEIFQLARREGVLVFSDEMYRCLEHDPSARLPAACELSENAVSLSGMSKSFGLPGLRTGWLAFRNPRLLEKFQSYKDYTTICASAPGEILALAALRARDAILARNLQIVRHNLKLAEVFFEGQPDLFEWIRPDAGSTAFPRWLGSGTVEDFCKAAVEKSGVMVVPGSIFSVPGNHFRVGLGRSDFYLALEAVGEFLVEQSKGE